MKKLNCHIQKKNYLYMELCFHHELKKIKFFTIAEFTSNNLFIIDSNCLSKCFTQAISHDRVVLNFS